MIGQAQTGTGKTAAFGLPMIEYVDPDEPRGPGARAHADARAVHPGHPGAARLRRSARASTSSPSSAARRSAPSRRSCARAGRSWSAPSGACSTSSARHSLMLHACRYVVLDEADEMLDLGFLEDVEKILSLTPERPPDRALQRDHAAADPRAGRSLPLRPGHGEGQVGDADDRHASSSSTSRSRRGDKADKLVRRAARPSAPTRRSSSRAPRSAATSSTARCATAA